MSSRSRLLGQIILRIDDVHGHHIIRVHPEVTGDYHFTIEGYQERPSNYLSSPCYFLPLLEAEVANCFKEAGKVWLFEGSR